MRARIFLVALLLALAAVGGLLVAIVGAMSIMPPVAPGSPATDGPCVGLPAEAVPLCESGLGAVYILECWVLKLPCMV